MSSTTVSRAFLGAQTVNNLSAMEETRVQSLGWEDPLEKEIATHSSILTWWIPWREEPGRLQSMGLQRVGHNWATNTFILLLLFPFCRWRNWGTERLRIMLNVTKPLSGITRIWARPSDAPSEVCELLTTADIMCHTVIIFWLLLLVYLCVCGCTHMHAHTHTHTHTHTHHGQEVNCHCLGRVHINELALSVSLCAYLETVFWGKRHLGGTHTKHDQLVPLFQELRQFYDPKSHAQGILSLLGKPEQLVTPVLVWRTNCMFCYFFPLNTQGGIVTIQSCIPQTFIERLIRDVTAAQEPSTKDGVGQQESEKTFHDSHQKE